MLMTEIMCYNPAVPVPWKPEDTNANAWWDGGGVGGGSDRKNISSPLKNLHIDFFRVKGISRNTKLINYINKVFF